MLFSEYQLIAETSEKASHIQMDPSSERPSHLFDLLRIAAETSTATISIYPLGETANPIKKSYKEILCQSQKNAELLLQIESIAQGSQLLLHFDQHLENIEWFWSAIVTGLLPAMSPPFVSDQGQRRKHLIHMQNLFQQPVILTQAKLVKEFLGLDQLNIYTTESLRVSTKVKNYRSACPIQIKGQNHTAVLMLTSGSTGNAKAVSLSHRQLICAINGKQGYNETTSKDVFLNWIGLDHVAGLSEIHLHAMSLGAEQIHVQAADLLQDPLYFLHLLHKHRVTYTFAPNFFLALLRRNLDTLCIQAENRPLDSSPLDLSSLRIIQTGGEAAVVETCRALTEHLQRFGVPRERSVIRPGFGMTETCAGSIYHKQCPTYDLKHNLEFAPLGTCMSGIQIRIVTDDGAQACTDEIGNLQITGPAVFSGYFNNPQENIDAFTEDGWFITGDKARIDETGYLNLVGRLKETIIINGVKYSPHELEAALEQALIAGMTASNTIVFPHRPEGSETESFCVVYVPGSAQHAEKDRTETAEAINKVCGMVVGVKPYQILPLESCHLPKSSLGKISRVKLRSLFESGVFDDLQFAYNDAIRRYRMEVARHEEPATDLEKQILEVFATHFHLPAEEIGVNSSIYDLGVTSVELIGYRKALEERLDMSAEIQLIVILSNPTIQSLANALALAEPAYNPVVVLQPRGDKTPLWLVHPGVGEILVFLNLAKYITDRPVYALRARGFNKNECFFESIEEVVNTYHHHIKKTQPQGPYAIGGYSFGAMLAFEIAKVLEANGDEVRFLGSFNLPPHIKTRMRQLNWTQALLNLSYFLNLITESYAQELSSHSQLDLGASSFDLNDDDKTANGTALLDTVVQTASPTRLNELSLTKDGLAKWTSLAHAMQQAALDYEPSGSVSGIDVFIAVPLVNVAPNREEWVERHLKKWEDFSRTGVRFHDVDGMHYTMMDEENVFTFQKRLRAALRERGL